MHIPGLQIPINTIFCIGRNYAEHAAELNNPIPGNPIIFTKPKTSVIFSGDSLIIPPQSNDVHFEAEMVVAIGKSGKNIPREKALSYVAGYGIGIDFTARDIQSELKAKSHPWDLAKGLDTFAPLGNFVDSSQIKDPQNLTITLSVNGIIKQNGNTRDMLFPVDDLISRLSKFFTLTPGDLIFSGTPAGVGPVRQGDLVVATLQKGISTVEITVKNAS